MGLSGFEIFIILLVVVLLFGSGKISGLLGDLAQHLTVIWSKGMNRRLLSRPRIGRHDPWDLDRGRNCELR